MIGIILAAGRGSRMKNLTRNVPKTLLEYKGSSLLSNIIRNFKKAGIKKIYIVTGYQNQKFRKYKIKKIFNGKWKSSSIFFSLYKARKLLKHNTCIVSYGDIFYKYSALKKLKSSKGSIVLLSLKNWKSKWKTRFKRPLSDLESFNYDNKKYLIKIGDKVRNFNQIKGQFTGLLKFNPDGWAKVERFLDTRDKKAFFKKDITGFLKQFIKEKNNLVSVVNFKFDWNEIDHPKDLNF